MSRETLLVIDDEPDIRELLSLTLQRMGFVCDLADSYAAGIQLIDKNDYFLVLTDMRLPDGSGTDVVTYLQNHKPNLPVAVITAFGSVESAVNTLKAGAFDYVSKPIDIKSLRVLVKTAQCMYQRPDETQEVLIGESDALCQLHEQIHKLARSQAPILIQGESGVGKELVARLIHAYGPRRDKPFLAVNCGAIPTELMESEFFGHKKGSFTGAYGDKQGLFVAAEGGTLFLDEIAELPLVMQVKLLRVIQEKAVKPIGELTETPVDVRILSASNKDLQEEITAGRFRRELYYRVNVIEIQVPSLRARPSDIPLLADHILKKIALDEGRDPGQLTPGAMAALRSYSFPGNVRELENILARASVMANQSRIDVSDLGLPEVPPEPHEFRPLTSETLEETLFEHERQVIIQALDKTKWNRTAAAKLLGVTLRVLRYRLKKLGIH